MGKGIRRFICIGGQVGRDTVSGVDLMRLYELDREDAVVLLSDNEMREMVPEQYTILRPIYRPKAVDKHSAAGYGYPHVNIPLTGTVQAMFVALRRGDWTDPHGMMVFADALEEAGYDDPRFPWLLPTLRNPTESLEIPKRIWDGAAAIVRLQGLLNGAKAAWDQLERLDKPNAVPVEEGDDIVVKERPAFDPKKVKRLKPKKTAANDPFKPTEWEIEDANT
jgi:hypothetical protein